MVNCLPGSLTASTPGVTGAIIIEAVLSALSQALPERAIAPYARLCGPGQKVGIDPRTNKLYVYTSFGSAGGAGAVYGYDGYQCCCDIGTLGVVSKTDAEEEMVRFPWRIKKYEFLTDSPGAGKWRGAPVFIGRVLMKGQTVSLSEVPAVGGGSRHRVNKEDTLLL